MPLANMKVILLERVEKLGDMGETVRVRPGYARNFLIPQQKALRATKDNIAYFEAQKATLEKANKEKLKEAEKEAKKIEGTKVSIIRLASEAGQLFGSVNARDIADAATEQSGIEIDRQQIDLNQAMKTIGLFPIPVILHPELKVDIIVNIARSEEEAKIQEKTGKALIAENEEKEKPAEKAPETDATEEAKKEMLEDSALEAEKEQAALDAEKAKEDAKKEAEKEAKKAEKAAAEAAATAEAETEEPTAEETAETEAADDAEKEKA